MANLWRYYMTREEIYEDILIKTFGLEKDKLNSVVARRLRLDREEDIKYIPFDPMFRIMNEVNSTTYLMLTPMEGKRFKRMRKNIKAIGGCWVNVLLGEESQEGPIEITRIEQLEQSSLPTRVEHQKIRPKEKEISTILKDAEATDYLNIYTDQGYFRRMRKNIKSLGDDTIQLLSGVGSGRVVKVERLVKPGEVPEVGGLRRTGEVPEEVQDL